MIISEVGGSMAVQEAVAMATYVMETINTIKSEKTAKWTKKITNIKFTGIMNTIFQLLQNKRLTKLFTFTCADVYIIYDLEKLKKMCLGYKSHHRILPAGSPGIYKILKKF